MLGSLDASRIDLFWLVSSSQPIQNSTVSVLSSMVLGILGYLESPKLRSPHWTAPTAQLLLGKLASAMIFSTGSFRSPEQTSSHGAEDSRLDRGLVIQTFMGWKGKLQQKTDCQWRIMSHSSNLEKPHLQAEVAPRGVGLKDVGTSKLAIAPWSNKRVPSLRLQKTTPPANKGVQQHVVRKVLANTMYFPAGTLMVTDIYRYK